MCYFTCMYTMVKYSAFLLVGWLFCMSCKKKDIRNNSDTRWNTNNEIPLRYAKKFKIHKDLNSYHLSVFPDRDTLHYDFALQSENTNTTSTVTPLRIPVQRIIVTSTTDIPSLEVLGQVSTLVGFPSPDYISSPKVRSRISEGEISDVGQEVRLNVESVLALRPEVVVVSSNEESSGINALLQQNGITVIPNASWLERHPLGRVEWLLVYGILYDQLDQAQKIVTTIINNYNDQKQKAARVAKTSRVISGSSYKGVWYMPGGGSYMATLMADARMDYIWKDTPDTGSLTLDFERVLTKSKGASIWIGAPDANSIQHLISDQPLLQHLECIDKGMVFTYKKSDRGGIPLYEEGALYPDRILEDLIQIRSSQNKMTSPLHFYQKLPR